MNVKATVAALAGCLLAGAPAAQAQFSYAIENGTNIIISRYTGNGGAVTIPSVLDNLPVGTIGGVSFSNCVNVTSVTIPSSVTSIAGLAFLSCSGLTNVSIPGSVMSIGSGAFQYCGSLPSVTIPEGVTSIGSFAFNYCSNLASVTIPASVTNIAQQAFAAAGLTAITVDGQNAFYSVLNGVLMNKSQSTLVQYPGGVGGSYTIPGGVTTIAEYAFAYCGGLAGVTIPDGVASIGQGAFYECSNLASVTIPASVTNIGVLAFSASGLTAILVNGQNSYYSSLNGVLMDQSQDTLLQYPGGLGGSYLIPGGVATIAEYAFANCSNLTNIVISGGVTNIEGRAFEYCPSLASLFFMGNAPTVASATFLGDNLTAYYLPGATGWSLFFGFSPNMPALLWNPLIQTAGGSFGIISNQFGFNVTGTTNIPIKVEACTNLASPVWTPLATLTLTNGLVCFGDSQWTNYPGRFYRISSP
jgi:hypothetical protein